MHADWLDRVSPTVRGMRAYAPALPLVTRLDANESPWPLPREVLAALCDDVHATSFERYPDRQQEELKGAIASWIATSTERLVVGVGSDDVLQVFLAALARPGEHERPRLLVPEPTFVMYAHFAKLLGYEVDGVQARAEDDFAIPLAALTERARRTSPTAIIIASPNNPTGRTAEDAGLLRLAETCPRTLVVVDEAYAPFRTTTHRERLRSGPSNLVFTGTISKIGLAALRVGWLEADPRLTHELEKVRLPYNVATPSQRFATRILRDHRSALATAARTIREARSELEDILRGAGLRPLPSEANFVLADAGAPEAAAGVDRRLRAANVSVRAYEGGPLAAYLRVTVGRPEDHAALREALSRC